MTNDKPIHILARLEVGFRTNAAHLLELENDLTEALQHVRHFGRKHGSPDDWNMYWQQQWDHVERLLRRIRALVMEMCGSIESCESDRLNKALETWETIQAEDDRLVEALGAIRAQVSGLNVTVRKDWNIVARTLETHLETIHACGQTLRIKLELLKTHPREDVDRLVLDILSKLPSRTGADGVETETYEQEYRKAAAELDHEHHKFLGFMDVVKAAWMWIETPEERVRKNRSLRVDEAGISSCGEIT